MKRYIIFSLPVGKIIGKIFGIPKLFPMKINQFYSFLKKILSFGNVWSFPSITNAKTIAVQRSDSSQWLAKIDITIWRQM